MGSMDPWRCIKERWAGRQEAAEAFRMVWAGTQRVQEREADSCSGIPNGLGRAPENAVMRSRQLQTQPSGLSQSSQESALKKGGEAF